MQVFSKTDKGLVRLTNQDFLFTENLSDGKIFAVVCDGMGGANAGNIASQKAVELITSYVERSYSPKMSGNSLSNLIKNAIVSANSEIFKMSKSDINLEGMGTTVVAAIVSEAEAVICHVGDSRAYVIGDTLFQVTRDHSVVQNLIESGELTPEEAKNHPKKNIITRALGVAEDIISDCTSVSLNSGESIMLCTDGLTNFVDSSDIEDTFKNCDKSQVAEKLVDMANASGGGDNISVITVFV